MNNTVHIIGTGPAALMAGTVLSKKGIKIHFYDQKSVPGRKFLVAGNGGFNLTHSEEINQFIEKYNQKIIQQSVKKFSNVNFIDFLKVINISTYIGSSGKIFPTKGIKPIEVLNNWVTYLKENNCEFHFNCKLIDFTENIFTIEEDNFKTNIEFSSLILALGGASWKKTGSTGEWIDLLIKKGIHCLEFESSNSGFEIENWQKNATYEGSVIKNCLVKLNSTHKLGEIVLTNYGLEGSPIYFLNKAYRSNKNDQLIIDFKPNKSIKEIKHVLDQSKNHSEGLKKLKLNKVSQLLIKQNTTKETYSNSTDLSRFIKNFGLTIKSTRPIDEVISTVGGVSIDSINENYSLKNYPTIYLCGEMLDWDAPTGGYLIQGCVSSGYDCAMSIIK